VNTTIAIEVLGTNDGINVDTKATLPTDALYEKQT